MGICAGLMQATKATGLLFGFVMVAAVLVVDRPRLRSLGFRPWILAGVLAVTTAGLFYTSFGANPTGLRDSFATFVPMLGKAARTKDLRSYSRGNLVLANAGNLVYSLHVFHLPPGPIWLLHTFYAATSALMLFWSLRYGRATTPLPTPPGSTPCAATPSDPPRPSATRPATVRSARPRK